MIHYDDDEGWRRTLLRPLGNRCGRTHRGVKLTTKVNATRRIYITESPCRLKDIAEDPTATPRHSSRLIEMLRKVNPRLQMRHTLIGF